MIRRALEYCAATLRGLIRTQPRQAIMTLLRNATFWGLLLLLSITSQLISSSVLGDGFRGLTLDAAHVVSKLPAPLVDIIVVIIDDRSFQGLFGSKSPYDRQAIRGLLADIQSGDPLLVGLGVELTRPVRFPEHIVWAWGSRSLLGEHPDATPFDGAVVGVPLLLRGRDGVIRRYSETVEIDGHRRATFVSALASQACARAPQRWSGCNNLSSSSERLIAYAPNPDHIARIPAWRLHQFAKSDAWKNSSPLKGKIVLVGGTYIETNDSLITPVGWQPSVYITAQALATELDGTVLREVGPLALFCVKIFAGALVAVLAATLTARASVVLHLVIVPVCAVIFAAAALSVNVWIDVAPVLMAGFVHQWYHDLAE